MTNTEQQIAKAYELIGRSVVDIITTIAYVKKMRQFKNRRYGSLDNYKLADKTIQSVIDALPEAIREAHVQSTKEQDSQERYDKTVSETIRDVRKITQVLSKINDSMMES